MDGHQAVAAEQARGVPPRVNDRRVLNGKDLLMIVLLFAMSEQQTPPTPKLEVLIWVKRARRLIILQRRNGRIEKDFFEVPLKKFRHTVPVKMIGIEKEPRLSQGS